MLSAKRVVLNWGNGEIKEETHETPVLICLKIKIFVMLLIAYSTLKKIIAV